MNAHKTASILVFVTGRPEQPGKYLALINAAEDAVFIVDFDTGRLLDANPAAQRMFGYALEELVGLTGRMLHPPAAAAQVDEISRQLNSHGRAWMPRVQMCGKDGTTRWCELRMGCSTVDGQALYICIARDVSEAFEEHEALRRTRAQLIQAARLSAVGALGAGVAHELNQPLTAIEGFTQRMLRRLDDPIRAHRRELEVVLSEARRMAEIIDNLRSFSRVTPHRAQPSDPSRPVTDALALIRAQLAQRGIAVDVRLAPDLPVVPLDRRRMQQVILNLLTNARDAVESPAPGRPPAITIEVRRTHDALVYEVGDSGSGVPEADQPRLFDPFFTTKAPGAGTGLGLSIAYGIVNDHGGAIEYSAREDGGAFFRVRLPIEEELG